MLDSSDSSESSVPRLHHCSLVHERNNKHGSELFVKEITYCIIFQWVMFSFPFCWRIIKQVYWSVYRVSSLHWLHSFTQRRHQPATSPASWHDRVQESSASSSPGERRHRALHGCSPRRCAEGGRLRRPRSEASTCTRRCVQEALTIQIG